MQTIQLEFDFNSLTDSADVDCDGRDNVDTVLTFPARAFVRGLGLCRVLDYVGQGMFRLLTVRDDQYLIHRDRLSFRP